MNSSTAYANVLDVHLFQSISYKNQLFSGISYILKIRDSKGGISVNCNIRGISNCTNKLNTDKIIAAINIREEALRILLEYVQHEKTEKLPGSYHCQTA